MRNDKKNLIAELVIDFSVAVIRYCEVLEKGRFLIVGRQLMRSATSIGANVYEAQNAETKADFVHKMKVASKEASETWYWLEICDRCGYPPFQTDVRGQLNTIIRILSKIISTTKARFQLKKQ